jgi:hypothetical protein
MLAVLGLQPAVRASRRLAIPVRCDLLRDDITRNDGTQRRRRVWREIAALD